MAYLDLGPVSPARQPVSGNAAGIRSAQLFPPGGADAQPYRAASQVIGLSHPPYFEKTVEALRMLRAVRVRWSSAGRGRPELSIGNTTRLLELKGSALRPSRSNLGTRADDGDISGNGRVPAEQRDREADLIKRIIANDIQGGQRDWVLLNAAMLLYAAGKGTSIAGNLAAARQALESVEAKAKLSELSARPGPERCPKSVFGINEKSGIMKHLRQLEDQSVYILREAYKHFNHPAMLWSMGKGFTDAAVAGPQGLFGHAPFVAPRGNELQNSRP